MAALAELFPMLECRLIVSKVLVLQDLFVAHPKYLDYPTYGPPFFASTCRFGKPFCLTTFERLQSIDAKGVPVIFGFDFGCFLKNFG
jgi:hypothetical protein